MNTMYLVVMLNKVKHLNDKSSNPTNASLFADLYVLRFTF
jgi:hypothetical protein